jgi:hypothetical protein
VRKVPARDVVDAACNRYNVCVCARAFVCSRLRSRCVSGCMCTTCVARMCMCTLGHTCGVRRQK